MKEANHHASRSGDVVGHPPAAVGNGFVEFDIHGRAGVRVLRSPAVAELCQTLAPFERPRLARVDLTVAATPVGLVLPSHADGGYRYTESAVYLAEMDAEIHFGDGIRLSGGRDLRAALIPLLDIVLVERDAAMVRAATLSYRGHALALRASAGVGRASTLAKVLGLPRVSFMGDDWAFLTGDGQALGCAKPISVQSYQRRVYPHLFEGAAGPASRSRLPKSLIQLGTAMRPMISPHHRLADWARRWSSEATTPAVAVTPRQAFPHAPIATSAPLATAVLIERYTGETPTLETKDPAWMATRLIGNFHALLPGESRDVLTALGATGLVPLERFHAGKAFVLNRALAGKPCFLLRIPAWMPTDAASTVAVEHLRLIIETLGIA